MRIETGRTAVRVDAIQALAPLKGARSRRGGSAGLRLGFAIVGALLASGLGCESELEFGEAIVVFHGSEGLNRSVDVACDGVAFCLPRPGVDPLVPYNICLTASPVAEFVNWASCPCNTGSSTFPFGCSDANQCELRLDPGVTRSCDALWCANSQLTVEVIGSGKINFGNSKGFACTNGTCSRSFCNGSDGQPTETVRLSEDLTNVFKTDYFVGWEGDADCLDGNLTMSSNRNCVARFRKPVVSVSVTGAGRVIGGRTINCREGSPVANCTAMVAYGGSLSVSALPDPGAQFVRWSGCENSLETPTISRFMSLFRDADPCTARFSAAGPAGVSEIVSVANDESLANDDVFRPPESDFFIHLLSGSADLSVAAFWSKATNLTASLERPGLGYARHRTAGTTQRIGGPDPIAGGIRTTLSLSADGHYAAYAYASSDLFQNILFHVYRRDLRANDPPELISVYDPVTQIGTPPEGQGFDPMMSGNGRFVAYRTTIQGSSSGLAVRDTCTGAADAELCLPHSVAVSYDESGTLLDGVDSVQPRISRDGRFVLFRGFRSPGTPIPELYLHDRDVDDDSVFDEPGETSTILATPNSLGNSLQGVEIRFDLDASGRYVAFESTDPELPLNTGPAQPNGRSFLRDTCAGAPPGCVPSYTALSIRQDGTALAGGTMFRTFLSDLSGSGRYVMLRTNDGQTVGSFPFTLGIGPQAVMRDTCVGAPPGCVPSNLLVSRGPNGLPLSFFIDAPLVSDDGTRSLFFGDRFSVVPGAFVDEVLFADTGIVPEPNSTPSITSFSPAQVPAGSPELLLTIRGDGFVPGVRVLLNDSLRSTIFVSPRKIQVRVPQSDLATSSAPQLRVQNPVGGQTDPFSLTIQ